MPNRGKIVIEILGQKFQGRKTGEKNAHAEKNCTRKIGVKNNFSKSKMSETYGCGEKF